MQTTTLLKTSLVGSVAILVWLASALVRVENERYALFLGMCRSHSVLGSQVDFSCLANVQTRTSWLWHLYWAVFG